MTSQPATSRSGPYQFSLRFLLLIVLVAALVSSWLRWDYVVERNRRLAREKWLNEIGVSGIHMDGRGNVFGVAWHQATITDDDLVHLKRLKQLDYLSIDEPGISQETVDILRQSLPGCVVQSRR